MELNNNPLSRKENLVMQESGTEVLLYDLSENKAFCLNQTAAIVWELCDGKSSVAEISDKLGKILKQPTTDELVWLAIDRLKQEKLLVNSEDLFVDFKGLNRRDAIRKIGFASLVALPTIMAITSPTAAASASCGVQVTNSCVVACTSGDGPSPGVASTQSVTISVGGINYAACDGSCLCVIPNSATCDDQDPVGTFFAYIGACG